MIEVRDLSLGYHHKKLLDNVSTDFRSGQLTALIGRNGSGKSTFLRVLAGLNKSYNGEVRIGGESIKEMDSGRLSRVVSLVTTERVRIPDLKCRDVVAIGRAPFTNWIGRLSPEDHEIVAISIKRLGMESFADRTMDSMSDGECQRIMIARALAQATPVILLDEPTSFLDLPSRYELARMLRQLAHDENKCIIFSTHELDIAVSECDMVCLLADRKLFNKTPEDMKTSGLIAAKLGLERYKSLI